MRKHLFLVVFIVLAATGDTFSQWTQLPGKGAHLCVAMCVVNDAVIVATQDSNIFRSIDQGQTWVHSSEGILDSLYAYTLFSEGDRVYLGSNKGAYMSVNGGRQWVKIGTDTSKPQSIYAFFRQGTDLLMGGDSGIFRSLDSGWSWLRIPTEIPDPPYIRSFGVNNRYLYAGTENHQMYRSTDNGEHWAVSGVNCPNLRASTVWTNGADIIAFSNGGGYYRSTDYGDTWKRYLGSLVPGASMEIGFCWLQFGDFLLLGADRGVIGSTDRGYTWVEVDDGFDGPVIVSSMRVADGYMYAGTINRWIWRRPFTEILLPSDVNASIAPYALRLSQSNPNPAASATEISYSLPSYASVNLKLYNAMMQEIATLVNEPQDAGEHHATLDVSTLPSGVYYYRLSAGTSSLTRRMFIVK